VRADLLEKPSHADHDLSKEFWIPGVPTLALVGDVAFGITLFEIAEVAEMKSVGGGDDWVRVGKPTPRNHLDPHTWTRHRWLPTSRLGVHAYAAEANINWESYWREAKPGQLSSMFPTIASELEAAVPRVRKLVTEERAEQEERARKRRVEQQEWARRQEEERALQEKQRQREAEARREKELEHAIGQWRLARDIRDFMKEASSVVADAGMVVTPGGEFDRQMRWALAYADRLDPLSDLRIEVAKKIADTRKGDTNP
jgi:Skp family chaperone for outer membrane proteins